MKLLLLLALLAQPSGGAFDTPIHEVTDRRDSFLDELTLSQLMRLSTMTRARLLEARCAGLAKWQLANKSADAIPAPAAGKMVDEVAAAVANDVELTPAFGRAFVGGFVTELDHQRSERDPENWRQWLAGQEAECRSLLTAARAGTLTLHPLAKRSVVDPALASCYAEYRVAASRAAGEEAAGLARDADKAAALALKGKTGADLAAAEAALAAEAASAAATPKGEDEADMMRLVVCQPYLRGTAMQAKER